MARCANRHVACRSVCPAIEGEFWPRPPPDGGNSHVASEDSHFLAGNVDTSKVAVLRFLPSLNRARQMSKLPSNLRWGGRC